MKIGKQTIKLENTPKLLHTSSIVGPKEMQGPLAMYFETHIDDIFFGEKSFEKAESKLMKTCIENLLTKVPTDKQNIDCVVEQITTFDIRAYFKELAKLANKMYPEDNEE